MIQLPDLLGIDDAHLALGRLGQARHFFLGVHIEPADKNAVDRLESGQATGTPLRPLPHRLTRLEILVFAEDQGHIEGDPGGGQLLQRGQATRRGGYLDHAVLVAS